MLLSAIAVVSALAIWALFARRLELLHVTAPMLFVLAGVAVGFIEYDALAATLNTETAQPVAEIILALLLFIDASDVRGGLFGHDAKSAVRILLVAMPLGLGMSVALGLWLLPGVSWATLLVIACVVVPVDFAPAASALRDERIPERVRNLLNVEAGYTDGIASPIFIFALILAGDHSHIESPVEALAAALPQAAKAVLIGLALGLGLAFATNAADRRGLMTERAKRVILVTLPLLAYTLSIAVHGNGFVAAFVCGIAFFGVRTKTAPATATQELELLDDVGFLLTVVMWFVFGAAAVLALSSGVSVGLLAFCLLALTVVRMIPVLLSLLGSRFAWRERLLVGWIGPRGTTSIVFGLLAFNALGDVAETDALLTMVVVVLGSVVMHGLGAPAAARAFERSQPRMTE